MTASHLTALIVLHTLTTSLSAAMACMTSESDPARVLAAAQNNAAAWIHCEMQCAAEGV